MPKCKKEKYRMKEKLFVRIWYSFGCWIFMKMGSHASMMKEWRKTEKFLVWRLFYPVTVIPITSTFCFLVSPESNHQPHISFDSIIIHNFTIGKQPQQQQQQPIKKKHFFFTQPHCECPHIKGLTLTSTVLHRNALTEFAIRMQTWSI